MQTESENLKEILKVSLFYFFTPKNKRYALTELRACLETPNQSFGIGTGAKIPLSKAWNWVPKRDCTNFTMK